MSLKKADMSREIANRFASPMSILSQKMANITLGGNESPSRYPELDPLPRSFYERNTVDVARDLIGKHVVKSMGDAILVGRIVETEAYTGFDDPASHAFRGKTLRNAVMFEGGGLAYVYFIYGSSFCLNATSEVNGKPGAVLVRALQPVFGIREMRTNRGLPSNPVRDIANGPGKICQAMRITRALNGTDLTQSPELMISQERDACQFEIESSPRIGVTKARRRNWRFYINGSEFVSRR